jgi:polyisoprenoid-binding protein YceI
MTGGAALTDVRGWVEAPVRTLVTGNDRRDRDLVKTMDAAQYPNIRFELEGVSVDWERGDSAGVLLEGKFVIHGVSRP